MRLLKSSSLSAFYRYVNRKLDNSQHIPPIQSANGVVLISKIDKVNVFNEYFTLVFTQPVSTSDTFINNKTHTSEKVDFSPLTVFETIRNTKSTTSSGSDSILYFGLKQRVLRHFE